MINPTNVIDEKWDVLVILDACRYDIFKENYKNFLSGKLEKRISVGVSTPTWLKNTFTDYYDDIIYISGNPYINSKGIDYSKVGFVATRHFYKIVDVWDFGFDKFLKTTHPLAINKSFFKYYSLYPNKRFIVHYIQPHYPYVSVNPKYIRLQKNMFIRHRAIKKIKAKNLFNKLQSILPHNIKWKTAGLLQKLGFKINLGVGQIYLDKGWNGVKKAYAGDLRFVLRYVSDLVNYIEKGRIVITADHGERLGERGWFGHGGKRVKEIIEVPWLTIEKQQ